MRWLIPTVLALAAAGCGGEAREPLTRVWVAGRPMPAFDPGGPSEPLRDAFEWLLTRGLVEEDSSGAVVPVAAERFEVAEDGLSITFHLRPELRFADGVPCSSAHFARALSEPVARTDHATAAWAIAAVRGMDRVRAGRPVPELGIETPDPATLVLRLAVPDPQLPRKLALPGIGRPWRTGAPEAGWTGAVGLGPYRVVRGEGIRALTLARPHGFEASPDTIHVRFRPGAGRVRASLRAGEADLVWPTPPGLFERALPADYTRHARAAFPERVLLLVARADVPPTSAIAARRALAHGVNRAGLQRSLGADGRPVSAWFPDAPPFAFPRFDQGDIREWMDRGKLGRSFSSSMAYDRDGPAAPLARSMQGEWAGVGISVDLRPEPAPQLLEDQLRGRSQLLLVEAPRLLADPAAQLAGLVLPLRGPAVGTLRTGWRTREFDPWILPARAATPLDPAWAQRRVEEEGVALPIALLPWIWVDRTSSTGATFHGRYGVVPANPLAPGTPSPQER